MSRGDGLGKSTEGFGITRDQSVELIVKTCLEYGVTDKRQIAYILATAQHETGNFRAPEEDFGRSQARKLGYRGGEDFYGRGYVHLTHKDNYEKMDRLLGLNGELVRNPNKAMEPEIAAKVLVLGMRDGLFTGRKLDTYIDSDTYDPYNARRVVNGITPSKPWSVQAAKDCKSYAEAWERRVPALVESVRANGVDIGGGARVPPAQPAGADGQLKRGEEGPEVKRVQQRLNDLGYRGPDGKPLAEDGKFGPGTEAAVIRFQQEHGLQGLGVVGPKTLAALDAAEKARAQGGQTQERPAPTPEKPEPASKAPASHAIYSEAYRHFLASGNKFEYGRGDMTLNNKEGNGKTDRSRTEQDLDGDGLKGVDCSSFVWRGLKNAGYNVPKEPFSTHALFNGSRVTDYAKNNFAVIPAAEAKRANGSLQPGDIVMFKDKDSGGQHVGIVKGYDAKGNMEFIGSQVSTGPAAAKAGPGSYWNGGDFEIVGALRAKPEFQVRAPLNGTPDLPAGNTAPRPTPAAPTAPAASAGADGQLKRGEEGPEIKRVQERLNGLGYRGPDGKPLAEDGKFGPNTEAAVVRFQKEHGLQGLGVVGPKTMAALDEAEKARTRAGADGQLKRGEEGPEIKRVQERLNGLGYRGADGKPLAEDGKFGPNTEAAVIRFQKEHGLQGLGVVGPKTMAALDAAEKAQSQGGQTTGQTPSPQGKGGMALTAAYDMSIKYDDVKYGFGSKNLASGKVDCSGWVSQLQNATMDEINQKAGKTVFSGKDYFDKHNQPAAGIIKDSVDTTGTLMRSPLDASKLKEGMIIGEDNGKMFTKQGVQWDAGRYQGIDHITMVVKDPKSGQLMVSQSRGGEGVELMPLDKYLERKEAKGVELFATDPLAKARPLMEAAPQQGRTAALLSDPANPDNGMYRQALAGIDGLKDSPFKTTQERENAAAAMVADARQAGMGRIDHLFQGNNGQLFAVQGDLSSPAHQRIALDAQGLAQQPVEKSSESVQQFQLAMADDMQRRQEAAPRAMA